MEDLINNNNVPDIIIPIKSNTKTCQYKDKYNKLCELPSIKSITIKQLIEIISLINSFEKRNPHLYQNELSFTVFNFYSKEALFLFKLLFEKKFNVPINTIYIKKIKFELYKIHIFIFKPYSDLIQRELKEHQVVLSPRCITQESWFILDLIVSNLKQNNSSSFKLNILKEEISFLYLNVNLIYIASEYIKIKFNKHVCSVKKDIRQNACTYYFEVFSDKTVNSLNLIRDQIEFNL